ncbi:uncharacterized protein A1O9_09158 [Exophiala aquamarina CBS 119918]|uniref:Amino-acid N-acetyltransferase subunit Mak10 n=1 Tax=Exophiala aquamarina CBS 119918 TaxID=1182545 RepID=A0A072P4F1_9EURO|nr:uncharacterized protein A1O9_09158 [Exophiala aquamarina CBS 119918]KEF54716.1 hypothetical protein A1O9_09158 [Exophiala aquamarina CBS 119918]
MDSGCTDPDSDLEEFDFTTPLSLEEAIWLMDELMYREVQYSKLVAWHQGYPLSQTLFTSVYVERLLWPEPKTLSDAKFHRDVSGTQADASILTVILEPFCLALIKCCDLVLAMISEQHYYEEEDFATQIFNRPLLSRIPPQEILSNLDSARSRLPKLGLKLPLHDALKARLDVRYFLLNILQNCSTGASTDTISIEEITSLINFVEKTSGLGRSISADAFTLKMQRRLASSVPPRPMIVTQKEAAFVFFKQLVTDATRAFEVLKITCSVDLLVAYQSFMAQDPQPSVYVRALLQSFLTLQDNILGRFTLRQFITQDLQLMVLPNSMLLTEATGTSPALNGEQIQALAQFDYFINRLGPSYLNLFRTFCLNRSRVRRNLCHAALEWDRIQAEAEELDSVVQSSFGEQPQMYSDADEPTFSYSLSSWVYHYKLMQLRGIVQMGFQLSVYAPHEYSSMYWYLSYLSSTHLSHLERISFFVSVDQQKSKGQHEKMQKTLHQLYRHFTWLKATEALAKALHRVLVVVQRHGHLVQPRPSYSSDHLRYELRMRPFQHLSIPEPLPPDVAQQACSLQELSDSTVLEQALLLNQTAKKAWEEVLKENWNSQAVSAGNISATNTSSGAEDQGMAPVVAREWTKEVRNSIKACIGTSIAISALIKGLQGEDVSKGIRGMRISIPQVGDRDRWHPAWAVPKVLS